MLLNFSGSSPPTPHHRLAQLMSPTARTVLKYVEMIKSLPSSLACHFLGALSGAAFPPDHSKASFQCKPHLPEHFLGPRTASRPRPSQNISEPHPELSQNVIPTARTFPKAARGKPRTHTPEPLRNGPIPTPLHKTPQKILLAKLLQTLPLPWPKEMEQK